MMSRFFVTIQRLFVIAEISIRITKQFIGSLLDLLCIRAEIFQVLNRILIIVEFQIAAASIKMSKISGFSSAILAHDLQESGILTIAIQCFLSRIHSIIALCFEHCISSFLFFWSNNKVLIAPEACYSHQQNSSHTKDHLAVSGPEIFCFRNSYITVFNTCCLILF